MRKDVTICIGTVGYPTFHRCYSQAKSIYKSDPRVKDLVVIKDRYPTSAWLNEMRTSAETQWILQVDEDMYIYDICIDILLNLSRSHIKKGKKILNASGLLHDTFLDTKIGSLKLWNVDALQVAEFKDVQGSDRQFAKDAGKHGFQNVEVRKVLGEHDSAPSPEIAYFKYKEYIMKIRRYQNDAAAKNFCKHLAKISKRRGDSIGKLAYEGGLRGLKAPLDSNTKNFTKNMESEELRLVLKKYGIER
jgi:hypothetical protein